MSSDNMQMLQDTLSILEKGSYEYQGQTVPLKLTRAQMEQAAVFLPRDVKRTGEARDFLHVHVMGRCGYGCENADAFALARLRTEQFSYMLRQDGAKPVLVLNMANPVNPGGAVRMGADAQEEDLCRKSSLLLSLESRKAEAYYAFNRSLNTDMGSDALMIHPQVEIIRDEDGNLLPETVVVAVMTCAAPMLQNGLGDLSQREYEALMYGRITGMLKVAAYLGYQYLVLGAFGCGAFQNDAKVVSDLFYRALREFDFDGMREKDMFRRIDFAVLCPSGNKYNYLEFRRNFSHFYRDEDQAEIDRALREKKKTEIHLDAIRGCIFGGAAGDALGYPVEFLQEEEIFRRYGSGGITAYSTDPESGNALISDDTQMSLFTATGLLFGDTRGAMRGIQAMPRFYVMNAYLDWLKTQELTMQEVIRSESLAKRARRSSWLLDVPEMYAGRAPGNTCLSALRETDYSQYDDFVEAKWNDSKGCGGIMRIAPLAVNYGRMDIRKLDMEGAQIAAITHGHSLGYMPAAVLVHVIHRIVFPPEGLRRSLKEIILEARDTVASLFKNDPHIGELTDIIDRAVMLSETGAEDDLENIRQLGKGWVAEETLAISLYCALRHRHNFSAGIIAAVNHGGDSDSTGAVTGNILGALLGYRAIPNKWKFNLELSDVILDIADDLCHGCRMSEYSHYHDPEWSRKYMTLHAPVRRQPSVLFWKDDEENGCFSNWFKSPFVIDGIRYLHAEQYMMAQKARLFGDSERYSAILRATEPRECKNLGKQVTPFDPSVWDGVKYDIVKTANRAKFEQNPELKAMLESTGNAVLAEASPLDRIWGIGLNASAALRKDPSEWPGQNLLGRILMELRTEFFGERPTDTILRTVNGDITKISNVAAIVNAANTKLLGGGGVDGAIHRAAGPKLLEECRTLQGCRTGEAKLTRGYDLPVGFVIHTVGPFWRGGTHKEAEVLADCYRSSLQLAVDHQIRSVAFPSIATGAYCFPVEEAARIAVSAVDQFVEDHPGKLDLVEWVLFDDATFDAYRNALQYLRALKKMNASELPGINRILRDGLV